VQTAADLVQWTCGGPKTKQTPTVAWIARAAVDAAAAIVEAKTAALYALSDGAAAGPAAELLKTAYDLHVAAAKVVPAALADRLGRSLLALFPRARLSAAFTSSSSSSLSSSSSSSSAMVNMWAEVVDLKGVLAACGYAWYPKVPSAAAKRPRGGKGASARANHLSLPVPHTQFCWLVRSGGSSRRGGVGVGVVGGGGGNRGRRGRARGRRRAAGREGACFLSGDGV